jgi:hypothetical protein
MILGAGPPGTPDFYSAAAQIIPVLVLVVIIEQRDEKRRFGALANLLYVLTTVGAASIGEIVALRDVYRGHSYLQDQYIVVASMIACALSLTAPIVVSSVREIEGDGKRVRTAMAWVVVLAVVYIVIVLLVAVVKQP